jgi:hypothetical protein
LRRNSSSGGQGPTARPLQDGELGAEILKPRAALALNVRERVGNVGGVDRVALLGEADELDDERRRRRVHLHEADEDVDEVERESALLLATLRVGQRGAGRGSGGDDERGEGEIRTTRR